VYKGKGGVGDSASIVFKREVDKKMTNAAQPRQAK